MALILILKINSSTGREIIPSIGYLQLRNVTFLSSLFLEMRKMKLSSFFFDINVITNEGFLTASTEESQAVPCPESMKDWSRKGDWN